jgi:hypothetical protein
MSPDVQIRERLIAKTADFFGDIAKRRTPNQPDPSIAELYALGLAGLAGVEVPSPLPSLGPVAPVRGGNGPVLGRPKNLQPMIEQARALAMASGFKRRPSDQTCLVYAAFLSNPKIEWNNPALRQRTGLEMGVVSSVLDKFTKLGIVTKPNNKTYVFAGPPGV